MIDTWSRILQWQPDERIAVAGSSRIAWLRLPPTTRPGREELEIEMQQRTAQGTMVGSGDWRLIPPGSEDFSVYGTRETVERARRWAFGERVLMYSGPGEKCVHGLYRMDSCTFRVCTSVGFDHTSIWVRRDARSAFILTQPYVRDVPERMLAYAEMHGLRVDSYESDGWYGGGTMPIRLTIPDNWPLWPIERDAAVLLHTQPVSWPIDDELV